MNITQVQILHTFSYRHTQEKHSHYNNSTPLCIKTKNVKTKSSFSPALGFGGCNDTVHKYKKKKDETCKIKHIPPKKLHLYSISRALFVQFQFDTCFNYMLTKRSHFNVCSFAQIKVELHTDDEAMSTCAFVSVALTLVALFFLHNTIQVHRSLSANTCRDEPTGEKSEI